MSRRLSVRVIGLSLVALSCGNDPARPTGGDAGAPDIAPPAFAGIQSAVARSATEAQVSWNAGSDDTTPFALLRYRVFVSATAGREDFSSPKLVTAPGVTSVVLDELEPATTYYVVVRATDAAGNQDGNTSERAITTPVVTDRKTPIFDGLASASSTGPGSIALAWTPATDDVTPVADIIYNIYVSAAPGLEDYAKPTKTTPAGALTATIDGFAPLAERFFVVRARDAAGNEDANRRERSARTGADVTPPVFAGATSVGDGTPNRLTVSWSAATDDISPPAAIKYSVCQTATPGACSGSGYHVTASVVGATTLPIVGLAPAKSYDFVVRAEDAAHNRDANDVVVSGRTESDVTPPTFTAGVTVAPLLSDDPFSARKLSVAWSPASDDVWPASAMQYRLCWNVDPGACAGSAFTTMGVTSPGQTAFTATLLQPYTQYTVFVRAVDGSGNAEAGDHSATASTAVSFVTNVEAQIFAAASGVGGCSGGASCHTPALSRANTVDVESAGCTGFFWVRPGDPMKSLVYLKMANLQAAACAGEPMPAGGPYDQPLGAPYPSSVTKTQAILDWIAQGAHAN